MADAGEDPALFVGRLSACTRIAARLGETRRGMSRLVLVAGEAGIGKTTCVRRVLETQLAGGGDPSSPAVWGACRAGFGAPGLWPWTQALGALAASRGRATCAADDAALLAAVVPAFGPAPSPAAQPDHVRLLLFDAVARWLTSLAADAPVVIVLDDLQWADRSSLELLDFLGRSLHVAPVMIIGTYRHDEVADDLRELFVGLSTRAEHIPLAGLADTDVERLVAGLAGPEVAAEWAAEIHRRTGGHPFFVRELATALDQRAAGSPFSLPVAVRDVIEARLHRAGPAARPVLEIAAVLGNEVRPDLIADVLGAPAESLAEPLERAVRVGVLLRDDSDRLRFAHDLFRETVETAQPAGRRLVLHQRIGDALERRESQGRAAAPAELARHFAAAAGLDGYERAVRWALAASAADRAASAFSEAAGHLVRVRGALADAGLNLPAAVAVELLVAEADARARSGAPEQARDLLAAARPVARQSRDPSQLAAVAFGVQRLGARFAMPRQPVIDVLNEARAAARTGAEAGILARLTAALAREFAHSVPEHRPQAGPLSIEALDLARVAGDADSLMACLLARHDVLWTPGTAAERLELANGLVELAEAGGDVELRAQGLLLVANALLESGAAEFRPALLDCIDLLSALGEPRHRYTAITRRAALHLLDGDLDAADSAVADAARLGERIGEPDTGNVRMSQRLALVQLRADPAEQRAFAAEAVRWWVGAPVHAHAVAAGFLARAGDLDAARREIDAVVALGTWRADRSYLWSVFIGQLAEAAALLGDRQLCRDILDDLLPLAGACGVNGAVVAFAGSLSHPAGLAAAAAGRSAEAVELLGHAVDVHRRLRAPLWESASEAALGALTGGDVVSAHGPELVTLRQSSTGWVICYRSRTVDAPSGKGWQDLTALLRQPGVDLHVLELMASGLVQGAAGDAADAAAIRAYRARLRELEVDLQEAEDDHDLALASRLRLEAEALVAELGRVTGRGTSPRPGSTGASERARKAVSARIRDAIRRLDPLLPDLAAHLDRNVVTGTWCRYRPEPGLAWRVEP